MSVGKYRTHEAIRIMQDHAEVPLNDGTWCLIDIQDVHLVEGRLWSLDSGGYPRINKDGSDLRMHNLLMRPPPGFVVDHRNGDKRDSRRQNFRIVTPKDNALNRNSNGGFKFKGTSYSYRRAVTHMPCWRATIAVHRKRLHIGYFNTEIEAAKAYDSKAITLHGDFASLNFP